MRTQNAHAKMFKMLHEERLINLENHFTEEYKVSPVSRYLKEVVNGGVVAVIAFLAGSLFML